MIQIVNDGVYRVALFCDACNNEITNAELALYTWDEEDQEERRKKGDRFTPHFYHKGPCAESTVFNNQLPLWDELSRFPVYLVANLKVDWKRARESAREMASW